MKPDIIVTWAKNCDFPIWRQFIRDNRTRFNEIIIGIHNSNTGTDYTDFIRDAMHSDYVHMFNAPEPRAGIDDWRDLSVNAGLLHSYNSEWVWFTEQDFYPGNGFWENVESLQNDGCEVMAVYQADRMHPCCIFVKRSALNKTRKMFGIVPDKSDHFSLFQKDLENAGVKIGKIDPETYYHYNGLSQNWYLASLGQEPNYHLPEFVDYLKKCLKVNVPIIPAFAEIATRTIAEYEAKTTPPDHSPTLG